ncbi:sigma factor-like helix-turn-helix DNA-binding protein [Streptomyces sp. CA-135486]|uniref:sigma factor-like helix-turn-helix DNA-binding protein n=1 Tax=Streptomyces sp. CA-135486 TaxID=3240049 RepID=UPI003D943C32
MTQSTTRSATSPLPSPGERRRLREASAVSEEEVATALGVTRATVRSWERGRTTPRGRKREAYAKLLAAWADQPDTPAQQSPKSPAPTATSDTQPPARSRRPRQSHATTRPKPAAKRADRPPTVPADPTPPHTAQPRTPARAADPPRPPELTADDAFDALYAFAAPALVRQTYLLTGRRRLAQESVERAFHLAWQRWPEVAVDRDPAGWVRAAAYDYAMSPWQRLRRTHRAPDRPPVEGGRSELLDALLELPPSYRRALLLYDGVGLDLPETAAETEASTPATANRVLHAREALAERLPELGVPETLHEELTALALAGPLPQLPAAEAVRTGSERRARFWTRAAITVTTLIIGATMFTLVNAPTRYEPPLAPGQEVGGVPAHYGPEALTARDRQLRAKLLAEPEAGPERLVPQSR